MIRILPILTLLLALHASAVAQLVLSVGTHVVPVGATSHPIDLFVSGDVPFTDMVLRIQIGDGGPFFNRPNGTPGPRLVEDIELADSIWESLPAPPQRDEVTVYPTQVQELSLAVSGAGQQVVANGRLCRLLIDVTGFTSGSFELLVTATLAGDSAFENNGQPVTPTLINGTLFIGDSPPPPLVIPVVTIERLVSGNIQLSFPTESTRTYTVEWDSDLTPPWTRIVTSAQPGTGGTLQWIDDGSHTGTHPSLDPKRFYRILIE